MQPLTAAGLDSQGSIGTAFYGNYSFYIRKFLMGNLRPPKVKEFKPDLVSNAHNFILDTVPTYFRDMLSLSKRLISTVRLYSSLAKAPKLANEKVAELLQFSNKVIYLETGSKNRYFLIQESQ